MELLILAATLTWNLIHGTLFVLLPAEPVVQVCIHEAPCFPVTERVVLAIPWDGEVSYVKAQYPDGAWAIAIKLPNYQG